MVDTVTGTDNESATGGNRNDRPIRPPAAPQYNQSNGAGVFRTMNSTEGPKKPQRVTPSAVWPMACSLLLLVQFFERLSFSLLQTVFVSHLNKNLGMDKSMANEILQMVIQMTFSAAIVGAVLADAKYGKYGTLFSLFPFYLLGQLLLTFSPIAPIPGFIHPYLEFVALFFLAYACGCIRGVLPAFGGDQIWPPNVPQLGIFFALFYAQEHLAIICCSLLHPFLKGLILWPLPMDKPFIGVLCFSIIFLFFSIAILLVINRYFRQTLPQGQNFFTRSWHTVGHAIHNKRRQSQKRLVTARPRHQEANAPAKDLLDHFLDDHNCERDKECDFGRRQVCGQAKFLAELKSALRILLVLSPLPLFWALQAQLATISAIQSQSVDVRLPFVGPLIAPEKLNLLPHLLVLLLIPILYIFIYPSASLTQCCSLNTYLRRMSIGIFLCAFACLFASSVQMLLNMSPTPPIQSLPDSAVFKLFNTFPADCTVSMSRILPESGLAHGVQVSANDSSRPMSLQPGEIGTTSFVDMQFRFNGSACAGHRKSRVRILRKTGLNLAIVGPQGIVWTAFRPQSTSQSSFGVLVLLPCNSLDPPLPKECVINAAQDPLFQALTPYSSSLALCGITSSGQTQPLPAADNSTMEDSNGTISATSSTSALPLSPSECIEWESDETIASQLFVFPPRGDNLGMGRGTFYEPKALPSGSYKLNMNPTSDSLSESTNSSLGDTSSTSSPQQTADNSNGSHTSLQQEIDVDDSGSISLILLALDGSPLAGQNDSSARPSPTLSILQISGPASLNVLWIFPQNLLMAASEVLICVTALEFTYAQAPNALKATIIGYWYLLVSLGMTLSSQLPKLQPFVDPVSQLLFASFLLISVGFLFVSLAHFFFKYRDNLTGAAVDGSRRKNAHQSGLAEKLEDTLRASMARLPTKKVIRL